MIGIEVSGVIDKEEFRKLLSQEFDIPVYFEHEINERKKKDLDLYKIILEKLIKRIDYGLKSPVEWRTYVG